MKRDYPLSTTPNPSAYTGGTPSEKYKTRGDREQVRKYSETKEDGSFRSTKEKTYKNLAGDKVNKGKKVTISADGTKYVQKDKGVIDDKTGRATKYKTKLNREIPQYSDELDLRKGVSKTNYDRNTGVGISRKQKDRDFKIGYGDTGMMAKTDAYSKDRAKEVLKSVGKAVKKVVSRKK